MQPLRVLASAVVSLNRANTNDFHFMQLMVNDVLIPEYNGYNTQIARESGQSLEPATHVTYFSLINMNPAEPDTILTTMHLVKSASESAGQNYRVFTNDQQLFQITTQMTWWPPDIWENFYPILGGMHMLMSFVGCIETLMANIGLSEMLKSAFGGVDKMLLGKNFPNNTRALCMCVEEILRPVILEQPMSSFDDLMSHLESLAKKSRTACLCLDALIRPVFIIRRFVRLC